MVVEIGCRSVEVTNQLVLAGADRPPFGSDQVLVGQLHWPVIYFHDVKNDVPQQSFIFLRFT